MSLRAEGEAIYTKLVVFSVARFGTWVVCIYRLQAVESLNVVNCSDLRPFLFLERIDNRTARARAVPVEVLIDEEKDIFAHP